MLHNRLLRVGEQTKAHAQPIPSFGGDRKLSKGLQKLPERSEHTNLLANIANCITKAIASRLSSLARLNPTFSPDVADL